MNLTVYFHFPNEVPRDTTPSEYGRKWMEYALDKDLLPYSLPRTGLVRTSVYLSTSVAARIEKVAFKTGRDVASTCAGLARAGIIHFNQLNDPSSKPSPSVAHAELPDLNLHRRKMQDTMVASVSKAVVEKKIVMIEAGTGSGKSRAIARSAREFIDTRKGVVVIAAPTFLNVTHLISEWHLAKNSFSNCGVLIGRGQFIDLAALQADLPLLKSTKTPGVEEVEEWINNNGTPYSDGSKRLAKVIKGIRWLADDLRDIAPEFPTGSYLLDSNSEESDSWLAHTESRESAVKPDTRVVFTTHAGLLGARILSRRIKGFANLLPERIGLLLIDEAHALEESLLSILSGSVSLLRMKSLLNKKSEWTDFRLSSLAEKAHECTLECAHEIEKNFKNGSTWYPGNMKESDEWKQLRGKLSLLVESLTPFVTKAKTKSSPALFKVLNWYSCLKQVISQKESVIISHSPVRKLGSLTVGPLFVKKDFDWLWDADNTPAAALFSGTLSYDIAGKVSYEFMRSKLCIPKERLSVTTPIYSKWSYSIPILHIPSLESAPDLAYPKNAEEADENDPSKIDPRLLVWWDAVAARLSTIGRKAKGGTLILCNSYRDIKELSDRLHGRVAADRLVLHQPGKSISQLRGVFIEKFESGVLPFWLASGPAWTGLDMRAGDEDPAKDFLLTDLVIVRIPYGMNRTSTHIAREAWNPNADFKGKEAILRLKQGLGRLMRQDGVTDRHIWFLDGRIKINGYDAKNCRILGKYIHVESF